MKVFGIIIQKIRQLKTGVYILYLAWKDPRVPWYVKTFLFLLVAYAVSPVDIIPDFIPVLGYIDDLLILPLGIYLAFRMIPDEVLEECRRKARSDVVDGKFKWTGIIIVAIVWLMIIYLIISFIS